MRDHLRALLGPDAHIELIQAGVPDELFELEHVESSYVLFFGRLSFICASAFFALAIFRHLPSRIYIKDTTRLVVRVSATFVILFSFYCYSSELERLGLALRPPETRGTA